MPDDFVYNPGVQSTANQSYSKSNSAMVNALMAMLQQNGSGQSGANMNTPGNAGTDYVQPDLGVQRGLNGY